MPKKPTKKSSNTKKNTSLKKDLNLDSNENDELNEDDADGVKYVYLTTFKDDEFGNDELGATGEVGQTAPEKTVSSMATRALGKR